MWLAVFYFVLATASDCLITLWTRSVTSDRQVLAPALCFVVTLIPMASTYYIIEQKRLALILVYSLGAALGCWLGMKIPTRPKPRGK